ncbi:conjugal transfer nickase/helicase domain-containing protein [Serratia sp. C-1]|uniref:conjugal transfer nickase/helicase domain-containing protein n=1 Tax=Serratia plymuthica TaxID=82996 RepID=UPI0003495FAE
MSEQSVEPAREAGTGQHREPELQPSAAPSAATAKNETQAHPSGEHFIAWLRQHISTRKLIINDAKALVHTVADMC